MRRPAAAPLLARALLAFAFAALSPARAAAVPSPGSAPPKLVGVAQEVAGPAGGPRALVRVGFERGPAGWRAVDAARLAALPARLYWGACATGRLAGSIATNLAAPDARTPQGTHLPTEPVPWAGPGLPAPGGAPSLRLHRPMALSSSEACADPGAWRVAAPTPGVRARLLEALRAQVKVQRCDPGGGWAWWDYGDADVELSGARASSGGAWIAELTISAPRTPDGRPCGGALGDGFATQLFLVPREGPAHRLGPALRLVDTGDWDGDGESEVLARSTREPGQYTLFFGAGLGASAETTPRP